MSRQPGSPLISTIVAVHNGRRTLQRCIDSILAQTAARIELVVIDGGSTDGTVELLRHYGSRIAAWTSEPDSGPYAALNKGLARASGEWIYVIGADDYLWSNDVLERMIPHLERAYPPARVVYGQVAYVNERGGLISTAGRPWSRARKQLRDQMSLPHQAVFHHRSLFSVHGPFNESFKVAGDYEMLLRELKDHDAIFVPEVIAGYQFGGGSSIPENNLRVLFEWRRAQKLNGFDYPTVRWLAAVGAVYVRMALCRVFGDKLGRTIFDALRAACGRPRYWTRI